MSKLKLDLTNITNILAQYANLFSQKRDNKNHYKLFTEILI